MSEKTHKYIAAPQEGHRWHPGCDFTPNPGTFCGRTASDPIHSVPAAAPEEKRDHWPETQEFLHKLATEDVHDFAASSPAPVAPAAEEIEYIDACDPQRGIAATYPENKEAVDRFISRLGAPAEPVSEPGYRGTRSLESRLALAVNEAHYYLCCVQEGIAERSPGWSIRLRDRLGAILEEAERAGLLEGAALQRAKAAPVMEREEVMEHTNQEPAPIPDDLKERYEALCRYFGERSADAEFARRLIERIAFLEQQLAASMDETDRARI